MKSPFAIFRKHQKVLMVVLTGMAMFAFVLLGGPFRGGQLPRSLIVLLVTGLVAGIFWIVGTQTGKPTEYALSGALLGAIAAFVGFQLRGTDAVVETKAGDLSQTDITNLLHQRQIANQFIQTAYVTVHGPPPSALPEDLKGIDNPLLAQRIIQSMQARWRQNLEEFLFGDATEQNAVLKYILLREADRLGVIVDDREVNDYINRVTADKLGKSAFRDIYYKRLKLSETELYNILRDELRARRALELSAPTLLTTPEEYWQYYKRLHVKEQLEVAALPVEHFAADVPEPTDEQIAAFFQQHKSVFPGQTGPGEPGFRQPRKVRLAFLEADYQTFEPLAPEVTAKDVEAFYEENKESLYRNRPVLREPQTPRPSRSASDGNGEPPTKTGAGGTDDSKPIDPQFTPEAEPPSTPTPDGEPAKPTNPANDGSALNSTGKPKPQAFLSVASEPAVADKPQPASPTPEPAAASSAAEGSRTLNEPVAAPKPLKSESPPSPVVAPKPLPEFRPLDDDLRAEIGDILLRQRTTEAIKTKIAEALSFMYELGDKYNAPVDPEKRTVTPQQISDRLQQYAEKNHLRYVVTELLAQQDLADPEAHPIGTATQPGENAFDRQSVPTVAEQAFETPPEQVYLPTEAEGDFGNSRYAWWKIEDNKAHVPTLEEPGVREQVIQDWKREHARPVAQKRADKLAQTVRQSDKPMQDVLAEQTITGQDDSVRLTVRQTQSFSWLRRSTAPPTGLSAPTRPVLSEPIGVEKAGPDFMRSVFDRLKVDDVGVVPNHDRSVYYVVRVKNRDPATTTGWDALRQNFMQEDFFSGGTAGFGPTTYDYITYPEQQRLGVHWREQLEEKYAVRWHRPADTRHSQR